MNNCITDDNELYNLINDERIRQKSRLELIASENFTSTDVMSILGSIVSFVFFYTFRYLKCRF